MVAALVHSACKRKMAVYRHRHRVLRQSNNSKHLFIRFGYQMIRPSTDFSAQPTMKMFIFLLFCYFWYRTTFPMKCYAMKVESCKLSWFSVPFFILFCSFHLIPERNNKHISSYHLMNRKLWFLIEWFDVRQQIILQTFSVSFQGVHRCSISGT